MDKNKGIIGIGLIIAIVLGTVVVGGGAYFLGKSGSKQEVNNSIVGQRQEVPVVDNKQNNAPSISVISPNGGEQLIIGSKYNIKYKTNLAPKDAVVFIFIGLNGQDKWLKIDPGYPNSFSATSGSYEWTIPKEICGVETCTPLISGQNYKLKVILTGTINNQFQDITSDLSDVSFTINSGVVNSSEESSIETFKNQPGAIKSIKVDTTTHKWIFAVDLLSNNHNWVPGVNDRYLNQNTKIRNLNVTSSTKTYGCVSGPDGSGPNLSIVPNASTASYVSDVQKNITEAKSSIKYRIGGKEIMTDWETLNFDINGSDITVIYNICLP